jgi:hypothetical protein
MDFMRGEAQADLDILGLGMVSNNVVRYSIV